MRVFVDILSARETYVDLDGYDSMLSGDLVFI